MEFINNWGITIFSVLFMLTWFSRRKDNFFKTIQEHPFCEHSLPQEMQSLGVIGTFLGITVGLWLFGSADRIQDGVYNLLAGMRTAFLTSLTGMVLAMYLKYSQKKFQDNYEGSDSIDEQADISDLIKYMVEAEERRNESNDLLLQTLKESNSIIKENIFTSIEDMKKSIVGDGDYTLIGQIKTMRLENKDSSKLLVDEFRSFAKNMAENNAKSFIEALTNTMNDFNTKLTEQFGENFKQLNLAVGRLLEWQENYILTVRKTTEQQNMIFNRFDEVKVAMEEMVDSSKGMKENADKMSDLIVTAAKYNHELNVALNELGRLGDKANGAISSVEELMTTTNKNMESTSNKAIHEVSVCTNTVVGEISTLTEKVLENSSLVKQDMFEALQGLEKNIDKLIKSINKVAVDVGIASESIRHDMETNVQATHDAIKKAADNLQKDSLSVTQTISDQLDEMMKTNNESLKKASNNMHKDLDQKIEDSMESLGRAMAAISQKFAKDYSLLADSLEKIVNMAARIDGKIR